MVAAPRPALPSARLTRAPAATADMLRKYPSIAADVLPHLEACLKRVDEPDAKASVIWMFGEFGHLIENSPYVAATQHR